MFHLRNLFKGLARSGLPKHFKSLPRPSPNIFWNYSLKAFSSTSKSFSECQLYKDAFDEYTQALHLIQQKNFQESVGLLKKVVQSVSNQQQNESLLHTNELNLLLQTYFQLDQISRKKEDFMKTSYVRSYSGLDELLKRDIGLFERNISTYLEESTENDDYLQKATEVYKLLQIKNPTITIASKYMMAILYLNHSQFDEAELLFSDILHQVQGQEDVDKDQVDLALVHLSLGDLNIRRSTFPGRDKSLCKKDEEDAFKNLEIGLDLSIKRHGEYSLETQAYCSKAAQTLLCHKKRDEAIKYAEKNFELSQKLLDANHPDLAQAYYIMGSAKYTHKHQKLLDIYHKAAEIYSCHSQEYYGQAVLIYLRIAEVYELENNYDEAYSAYKCAWNTCFDQFGLDSLQVADCFYCWAFLTNHSKNEKFKRETLTYFTKALDIYEWHLDTPPKLLAFLHQDLGLDKLEKDKDKAIVEYYNREIDLAFKLKKPNLYLRDLYWDLGEILLKQNKFQEAQKCYEELEDLYKVVGDPLAEFYHSLGVKYSRFDQEQEIEMMKKAFEASLKETGGDSDTYRYQNVLVKRLKELGRHGEAVIVKDKWQWDYSGNFW